MEHNGNSAEIIWQPDRSKVRKMDKFRMHVNESFDLKLESYNDLYQWSIDSYQDFWETFWHFSGIIASSPFTKVINIDVMTEIPTWFCESKLNYAENLLKFNDDRTAIIATGEGREDEKISYKELRRRVTVLASALRKLGIKKGDRVAGYLPNGSLAIEAMLATASLGTIWSSTSPDFGALGVLDRFVQIDPRIIFSVNAVTYNGKVHNHMNKLKEVVKGLPNLQNVILFPFVGSKEDIDLDEIPNSIFYDDFLNLAQDNSGKLTFEQVPFNHPLFIMYSSGTTGKPKCLVHSVGGTLIQHLKEHILHGNMTRDDVIIYYTTTGWMMWNWLVTSLAVGATVVLYDGSPIIPTPHVLLDLVDRHKISIFGASPKYLETLENKNVVPKDSHSLESLHTILSTGAPLMPATYDYVYNSIKQDLILGSISGGTDIISCFMGQNPTIPVYRGEIQSRNLGMAVESWDEDGHPIYDQRGELVCTKPFPSMPIYFWNDEGNLKYNNAYFAKYKDVWNHGDFCIINSETGGIIMLGRSDGTLNPNGVRFGSAEIYNVVERLKEVEDSLCVACKNKLKEERVILFVKMANGYKFTEELVHRIRQEIRVQLSPRHIPTKILPIQDIPHTTNGKKVEVAVKKILAGEHIEHRVAYRNPEALDLYHNLKDLQDL